MQRLVVPAMDGFAPQGLAVDGDDRQTEVSRGRFAQVLASGGEALGA